MTKNSDVTPTRPNSTSPWQQGATAAREGKPFAANPYSTINHFHVSWGNGWLWATHQIAKENDEEL